ncbi:pitrilysin family protein [Chryseolinea sp. T2]|uniref:M16 family metallopeptidase n=1 Tax=Chryseolinea sp. T2 TaxID=3129255 RepID=UPI003076D6D4
MKMRHILIACSIFWCLAASSASAQKQTPPAGGQPKDFVLPAKKTDQLKNGLRSTLVQYGAIPKVTINIIVKTGNVHEGPKEVWLADLTGNLMQEGTKTMDFKTISRKVAAMGGNVNIGVGADQVYVSGSVLSEYAPELVKVLADVLINPAFPASEIDRLKNDLKRNLSVQKSSPQQLASEKFNSIIYKDHPYGRIFPTQEMLDSYNIDMVKGFYDKNFGARRTVVYVVGKFDQSQVEKAIGNSFNGWKEGPEVSYPPVTASKSNEIATIDRPGAPQTTIILGMPTLVPKSADYVALQVTNSLLGGSFGSRITSNIREQKGYTYSPHSVIQNRKNSSVWYEEADVTTEHTGASLQEIAKEVKRLQNEAPSKEELEGIQKYMAGIFVLQNSSPGGIIGQLNFIDYHELDDSYLTNRVKNIYAITPEKVSQITKDNFKYEDMTLVMVGDKKSLEKQRKQFEEARKVK